jgi:hypothetical protein
MDFSIIVFYVDNNDGSVTDNATGLMLMQEDSTTPLNWEHALLFAKQKNTEHYLGYSDWRVPNIKELQSIVDYSGTYPAIDLQYFIITEAKPISGQVLRRIIVLSILDIFTHSMSLLGLGQEATKRLCKVLIP